MTSLLKTVVTKWGKETWERPSSVSARPATQREGCWGEKVALDGGSYVGKIFASLIPVYPLTYLRRIVGIHQYGFVF